MNNKLKIIIGLCSVFVVFAVILTLYLCWPAIEGTINGSRYYTEDDIQNAYDKGYNDGITNKDELTAQVESYKLLIEQNEITINDLNNQIEILTKQNQDYILNNKELNNTIDSFKTQIDNLEKTISDNEKTILDLNNTITDLNSAIEDLENDQTNSNNLINNLQEQILNLQKQIESLTKTNEQHQATINSLNLTIESLNKQIDDFEENEILLNTQIANLQNSITEYQKEIDKYKQMIEELKRQNYAVITFEISGEVVSTQSIKKGTHPTKVEDDRLNDSSFKGFVVKGTTEFVDPYTYPIEEDTIFEAVIERSYQVQFKVENQIVDTQEVEAGAYANEYTITSEDYVLDYWMVNNVKVDNVSAYPISKDTVFEAKLRYYKTVTYKVGNDIVHTEKVLEGQKPIGYTPSITSEQIFRGYKLNGSFVDILTLTIQDNISLELVIEENFNSYFVTSKSNVVFSDNTTNEVNVFFEFTIKGGNVLEFSYSLDGDFSLINIPSFYTYNKETKTISANFSSDDVVEYYTANEDLDINGVLSIISQVESAGFVVPDTEIELKYNEKTSSWEIVKFVDYYTSLGLFSFFLPRTFEFKNCIATETYVYDRYQDDISFEKFIVKYKQGEELKELIVEYSDSDSLELNIIYNGEGNTAFFLLNSKIYFSYYILTDKLRLDAFITPNGHLEILELSYDDEVLEVVSIEKVS